MILLRKTIELKTRRLVLRPLGTEYLQTVHAYASDLENTKYMMHLPNETLEETLEFLKNAEAEWEKDNPSFYEFAVLYEGRQIGAVSVYLEECADGEICDFGQDEDAGENSGAGRTEASGETGPTGTAGSFWEIGPSGPSGKSDPSGETGSFERAVPSGTPAPAGELGWVFHKDCWGQGFASEAAGALLEYAVRELKIRHFIAHCDAENPGSYRVMEKLGMTRTAVSHDRKNRASDEARTEYQYELCLEDGQTGAGASLSANAPAYTDASAHADASVYADAPTHTTTPAEPAAVSEKLYRFSSENCLEQLSLHDCACSSLSLRDGQLVCEMDWMEVRPEHPHNPYPEAHRSDAGEICLIGPKLLEGTLNVFDPKDRTPVARPLHSVEELDFRDLEFLRCDEQREDGRFLAKLFLIFDPNDQYDSLSLTLAYERSVVRWNALGAVSWFE